MIADKKAADWQLSTDFYMDMESAQSMWTSFVQPLRTLQACGVGRQIAVQPKSAGSSRQKDAKTPELADMLGEGLIHEYFAPGEGCCECTEGTGVYVAFLAAYSRRHAQLASVVEHSYLQQLSLVAQNHQVSGHKSGLSRP
jgi:hypothetical protein